jgi:tight adherence protein C
MILWIIAVAEILALCILNILGSKMFGEKFSDPDAARYPMKLKVMAPSMHWIVHKWKLIERFSWFAIKVHGHFVFLFGSRAAQLMTILFFVDMLSLSGLCVLLGTMFSALTDDTTQLGLGVFIAILMPMLTLRQLADQVVRRKRSMIVELPEVLNKLILLINAGETVQAALMRTIDAPFLGKDSPLRKELLNTAGELQMNISFAKALEQFSRRCALQEISMFTTTLMMNYKRGGDELVLALRSLAKELWDRRKAVSRTLGEEASSKLVFPMVVIFFVVMVVVGAPALMMMNQ